MSTCPQAKCVSVLELCVLYRLSKAFNFTNLARHRKKDAGTHIAFLSAHSSGLLFPN